MKLLYSHDAKEAVRRIRCNMDKGKSAHIWASIKDGCEKLKVYPDLGFELDNYGDSRVRALIVGEYAILYEHDSDTVYISAIAHTASDWKGFVLRSGP